MSLFDPDRSAERTPVGVVTGFLGSGKTTLSNRLLADARMAKSLAPVNEFGAIGLDHLFVESRDGDLVPMKSGCI